MKLTSKTVQRVTVAYDTAKGEEACGAVDALVAEDFKIVLCGGGTLVAERECNAQVGATIADRLKAALGAS